MLLGDVLLEVVHAAEDRHHDDHPGDPGEDRAHNEVRAEDRGVPSAAERHPEDPRHDGVDRYRNRNDHDRHHADRADEQTPLLGRVVPADRQGRVHPATDLPANAPVPKDREVGHERQVEVEDAAREIGTDRQEVPQDGRPQVRVQQNVQQALGSPHVGHDHAGDHDERDDGDHLREAGDGPAPLGMREPQDRRDQRPRHADAGEEHEVGEVEAPAHVIVQSGDRQTV